MCVFARVLARAYMHACKSFESSPGWVFKKMAASAEHEYRPSDLGRSVQEIWREGKLRIMVVCRRITCE